MTPADLTPTDLTATEMFQPDPALPGDLCRDFCLWDYAPVAPMTGRWHGATLLWQALQAMQAPPFFRQMLLALRRDLGRGSTVWGIKQAGNSLSVELYFYDYARMARKVSVERVLDILRPFVACDLPLPPASPYFMFSLDLDAALASSRRIGAVNLYLGNPGSRVSSGMSCEVTATGTELRNIYNFFDANRDGADIRRKITESARLDLRHYRQEMLLWRELAGAAVVVVANKRAADGLYYTRLRTDQLLWFLRRMGFHPGLTGFLAENEDRFAHLLFDVGFDYHMTGDGMQIPKHAFYGLL